MNDLSNLYTNSLLNTNLHVQHTHSVDFVCFCPTDNKQGWYRLSEFKDG